MRNQDLAFDGGHARRVNCIGNTVRTVKVFLQTEVGFMRIHVLQSRRFLIKYAEVRSKIEDVLGKLKLTIMMEGNVEGSTKRENWRSN